MYLACADEIIKQKQLEVKLLNDKLIQNFNSLPFWKRWGKEEKMQYEICSNWALFEIWMEKRIIEQNNQEKYIRG